MVPWRVVALKQHTHKLLAVSRKKPSFYVDSAPSKIVCLLVKESHERKRPVLQKFIETCLDVCLEREQKL